METIQQSTQPIVNVQTFDNIDAVNHKDLWWKLLYTLFTATALAYLYARRKDNRMLHLVKPLPVLILGYVVLLWCSVHHVGMSSLFHLIVPHKPSDYAVYISIGLFLSAIGDLLLIFDKYFVHGIIFFLTAHLSFILAFTAESDSLTQFFTPLVVVILVGFNIFFVYLFITKVVPLFVHTTPTSIVIALFFYMAVIITMCYTASLKALTKVAQLWELSSSVSHTLTIYSCCGAIGAVLFFISDLMILIREMNALKKNKVSTFRRFLGNGDVGMITYWLGQFCIALSVTSIFNVLKELS
ncbi:transmembrane protein [Heterostelium album PN500]|uniref:Transmembrane protein n=1 Tax=Heterostelium pallidum (strain ATCC 26659 / Pp 5 / PN500) TaxID=670386 RepID=D3B2R9_HETP5|nr:transmembrane protein [Heterostelium album PN500]EFA83617.1 transmembrane protein [Heterostelium album PN500]|eukprot:XP_020435734.1 transmembrane protein [Heterostelium album PN500]